MLLSLVGCAAGEQDTSRARSVGHAPASAGSLAAPTTSAAAGPSAPAGPDRASGSTTSLFFGDSYIVGGAYTGPNNSMGAIAARRLGWKYQIRGGGGTGFVAGNRDYDIPSFLGQIQAGRARRRPGRLAGHRGRRQRQVLRPEADHPASGPDAQGRREAASRGAAGAGRDHGPDRRRLQRHRRRDRRAGRRCAPRSASPTSTRSTGWRASPSWSAPTTTTRHRPATGPAAASSPGPCAP